MDLGFFGNNNQLCLTLLLKFIIYLFIKLILLEGGVRQIQLNTKVLVEKLRFSWNLVYIFMKIQLLQYK